MLIKPEIRPNKNYLNNQKPEFSGFINGQSVHSAARQTLFGRFKGGENGCGWIAVYNALLLCGEFMHPKDIILYLEKRGGSILFGALGTFPPAVPRFFKSVGIPAFGKLTPWAFLTRKNPPLDELCKNSAALIICYAHKKGAHFVAAAYKNGVFLVYNNYGSDNSPREYKSLDSEFFGMDKRLLSYCAVCPKNAV